MSYNFQYGQGRMTNILYLDSHIPFPRGTLFSWPFCGLIVSLVFLNLFPASPLVFLAGTEWCPASLKSKLKRWRRGWAGRGGGWGAREACSLGALALGSLLLETALVSPPPHNKEAACRSKETD